MNIEIKEIEITIGEEYNISSYKGGGMYITDCGLMFVYSEYVLFIMSKEEFLKRKDELLSKEVEVKNVKKDNHVSESFALKMLAVAQGHTLKVDINE